MKTSKIQTDYIDKGRRLSVLLLIAVGMAMIPAAAISKPTTKATRAVKNLTVTGSGERPVPGATTDVWAHKGYAYTGTFNSPCGGEPGGGVWIWDIHNKNKVSFVDVIPSPTGSRSDDVKVATMNSGDILVHSNTPCGAGPGGFEIYSVDDPANAVHLSHVQTDDINLFLRDNFDFTDFSVSNLFLFSHGSKDYVAAVVQSVLGNLQIFDITDPTNPVLVGFWGAEQLHRPDITDWVNLDDLSTILDVQAYLSGGFGASQNRFVRDVTVSADRTKAYLANWDAGLVLLDISDPANPGLVSVALDLSSDDGEVNSNSAWPSENGAIVVECENDVAPFTTLFTIETGPNAGSYPAREGSISVPLADLPGGTMSGPARYLGLACPGSSIPPASAPNEIALIQRGVCLFSEKINNAEAAGYAGVVVFNDAARGDALVSMGGTPVNLPAVFVGHSTGLAIAGVETAADLVIGAAGETVTAASVPDGWGGVRIWDYADPANPVLASTFNTVCSANVTDPSCDPTGIYTAQNVVVETRGIRVKAYVSWSSDGVLILDITDPYNPVETAHYTASGEDYWGVYKQPKAPWIYGSDRNGGLRVFREFGPGS